MLSYGAVRFFGTIGPMCEPNGSILGIGIREEAEWNMDYCAKQCKGIIFMPRSRSASGVQLTWVDMEAMTREKQDKGERIPLLDAPITAIEPQRGASSLATKIPPGQQHALSPADDNIFGLNDICSLDGLLTAQFAGKLRIEQALTRQLVSFQANKQRPKYRWYKYKEAFSADLVEFMLHHYGITSGRVLDPFAGSGTTLFASRDLGLGADGIELLPIGRKIIGARRILEEELSPSDIERLIVWINGNPWKDAAPEVRLPAYRITKGAYPPETHVAIERFLSAMRSENVRVQEVLCFALLCILESISYTRKDGQYLRWDKRSGRKQGSKPFDKGEILDFDTAVAAKLSEMLADVYAAGLAKVSGRKANHQLKLFQRPGKQSRINLFSGSCLTILPALAENTYEAIITSPPYCNRYDYTRTYALEMALLGVSEAELIHLRQQMLSCTVENRAKDLLALNQGWWSAIRAADSQRLLQRVLSYLDNQKLNGHLNNTGIPRMVRGYFYEMACVIQECARVLKPNGIMVMVNDNVRYAGASISVDLILSEMACKVGFDVDRIMVLPNGKGNSSQQMGEHGRDELRKCIYVWSKSANLG